LEGGELLEPPDGEETELLYAIRAPSGTRLACQAVVRPGDGLVRVRPIDG
jgi:ferredoxin